MNTDSDKLIDALRKLPAPEPRPGFVERALTRAVQHQERRRDRLRTAFTRWETWLAAAMGGAVAATLTVAILRFSAPAPTEEIGIALALNESRQIDVLIESARPLENATIRIAVSGGIELEGFDDEHQLDWQADLHTGTNLLSLPVIARQTGSGRLVAVVEHEGKTQTVAVDLRIKDLDSSRS